MKTSRQKIVGTVANIEKLELERLRGRVERLVAALDEALELENSDGYDTFSPPVDICENPEMVCIWAELPGVRVDSVSVTCSAKEIVVEGEKEHAPSDDKVLSHFCCERMYGRFHRRIILRWPVNINEAHAELKNGVLRLRLPKLVDRRGKAVRIEVESGEEQ